MNDLGGRVGQAVGTRFPGLALAATIAAAAGVPVGTLWRAADAVRAVDRHGVQFSRHARAYRDGHRVFIQHPAAHRRGAAGDSPFPLRHGRQRLAPGDGHRRARRRHDSRRRRVQPPCRAQYRVRPAYRRRRRHLRRFRRAGHFRRAVLRRARRPRHAVHRCRGHDAFDAGDDRLPGAVRGAGAGRYPDRVPDRGHRARCRPGRRRRLLGVRYRRRHGDIDQAAARGASARRPAGVACRLAAPLRRPASACPGSSSASSP